MRSQRDFQHGGDLERLSRESGWDRKDILDFSVNVNPSGCPAFIREALWQAMEQVDHYPSPRAGEVAAAVAKRFKIPAECLVVGNGSNELLHLIPRVLKPAKVVIAEPAFSEYRLACRLAGVEVEAVVAPSSRGFQHDPMELGERAGAEGMVMLANPANPSGWLMEPNKLTRAMMAFPDVLWVLDEAFIDYVGEGASLVARVVDVPNLIVLRSLTKFYGMAGIRAGFLAARREVALRLREALPVWNVSTFAAAAMLAVCEQDPAYAIEECRINESRRADLVRYLKEIPGIDWYPSRANFMLFHCSWSNTLAGDLLNRYGIAIRDCSNYIGLETGGWYRTAVRLPKDHERLALALGELAGAQSTPVNPGPWIKRVRKRPALMLQGTCSDAGKSVLASAFARILTQDGYSVAPFKAQNMALNSGVTALGEEMGRAQMVQARACRRDPDARMNPVLLKPHSDRGSQIVLMGKPVGNMDAREYFQRKRELWPTVCQAYDSLAAECEVMVLEGAGSPGEVNLKSADIVNMAMARYAEASVLLIGDIDRGGVYASFLGTWMTFNQQERSLLNGFIVNKFRGDASLLQPAHDYMLARTGIPVVGVVPMIRSLKIPEEDRASFAFEQPGRARSAQMDVLDVAVVMLNHVSNYTDFAPLAEEPDICLRQVRSADEFGNPDWVIIPGSKNVAYDWSMLQKLGLDGLIRNHAAAGKWILGVCGGLQLLGERVDDPWEIESPERSFSCLGLLPIVTEMAREKELCAIKNVRSPLGVPASGYEIHHGRSRCVADDVSLFFRPDGSVCGYGRNRVWGTYLHGLFEDDVFRRTMIDRVRVDSGLPAVGKILVQCNLDQSLDLLADMVREHVDLKVIYRNMGLL